MTTETIPYQEYLFTKYLSNIDTFHHHKTALQMEHWHKTKPLVELKLIKHTNKLITFQCQIIVT